MNFHPFLKLGSLSFDLLDGIRKPFFCIVISSYDLFGNGIEVKVAIDVLGLDNEGKPRGEDEGVQLNKLTIHGKP